MIKENKDNNNTNFEDQIENKEKINNKENSDEKKDIREQIEHLDFKEYINNHLNENYFLDDGIFDFEFEDKNNNIIEEKENYLNKKRKFNSNNISDNENSNIEIRNKVIKESNPQIS